MEVTLPGHRPMAPTVSERQALAPFAGWVGRWVSGRLLLEADPDLILGGLHLESKGLRLGAT